MDTIGARIRRLREEKNLTQGDLAKAAGVSIAAVSKWEKNASEPKGKSLASLSQSLGIPMEYLIDGKEPAGQEERSPKQKFSDMGNGGVEAESKSIGTKPARTSNVGKIGSFRLWSRNDPLPEDEYVYLPFRKTMEFKGGNGIIELEDYDGFTLPFAKATLLRCNIDMETAFCCTLTGDSMEPLIPDGATIGINPGETTIRDGKIYAFRHEDLFRAKRLYLVPGGKVRINSFNQDDPAYRDEIVPLEEIVIIGRVFTWSVLD